MFLFNWFFFLKWASYPNGHLEKVATREQLSRPSWRKRQYTIQAGEFESSEIKAWIVYFVLFLYFNQLHVSTTVLCLSLPYSINWYLLRSLCSLYDNNKKNILMSSTSQWFCFLFVMSIRRISELIRWSGGVKVNFVFINKDHALSDILFNPIYISFK